MHRPLVAASAAIVLLGAVVGCGEDAPEASPAASASPSGSESADPSASNGTTSPSAPALTPFDPPKKFAAEGAPMGLVPETEVSAPSGATKKRVVLVKSVAVAVGEAGFQGSDLATGGQLWQTPPVPQDQAGTVSVTSAAPPVTLTTDGRTVVVGVFGWRVKGSGTTKDHGVLSVQAVDPTDGKQVWKVDVDWSTQTKGDPTKSPRPAKAIADDATGLVAVGSGSNVVVVDAKASKLLWGAAELDLVALGKGIVMVQKGDSVSSTLQGLDARTKAPRWTALPDKEELIALGGSNAHAVLTIKNPATRYVVALGTGKVTATFPGSPDVQDVEPRGCAYDKTSVLACHYGKAEMFGIDDATGRKLWGFDNKGSRVAPRIRTALHGVIYGEVDNGQVLLDAKTGADLPGDPGISAMAVSEFGAATYESDISDIVLHRAEG